MVGVAYKSNIDDVRESPALDIIELLRGRGAEVHYYDPFVPSLRIGDEIPRVESLEGDTLSGFDAAVITTSHTDVDHASLVERCPVLVDTRNALKGVDSPNIIRL